jgi:hypothetical protein
MMNPLRLWHVGVLSAAGRLVNLNFADYSQGLLAFGTVAKRSVLHVQRIIVGCTLSGLNSQFVLLYSSTSYY